jgi:hypothetical protein
MQDSGDLVSQPEGFVKAHEGDRSYIALLMSVSIVLIALIGSVHILIAYRQ